MAQRFTAFRDFDEFVQSLPSPPEKTRCFLSRGEVVAEFVGVGVLSAMGAAMMVLFALTIPPPLRFLAFAATLTGFGTIMYLAMHNPFVRSYWGPL